MKAAALGNFDRARPAAMDALAKLCPKEEDNASRKAIIEKLMGWMDDPEGRARNAACEALAGVKAKVNLIPLNAAAGIPFDRPADVVVDQFARILAERDITVSVRKSRGRDIRAAHRFDFHLAFARVGEKRRIAQRRQQRLLRESPRDRQCRQRRNQRKRNVGGVKGRLPHVMENSQQAAQVPGVERRVRMTLHRHHIALKRIRRVLRMQRLNLGVLRAEQVVDVVSLNRLPQKRQTDRQHKGNDDQRLPLPHFYSPR